MSTQAKIKLKKEIEKYKALKNLENEMSDKDVAEKYSTQEHNFYVGEK